MLKIKLARFSMSCPSGAHWQLINVLDDDVHKNVCLGRWSAGCCVWPVTPASWWVQSYSWHIEVFLCIWKGMLLVITLRNKEEIVSNEHPITVWRERTLLFTSGFRAYPTEPHSTKIIDLKCLISKKEREFQRYRLREVYSVCIGNLRKNPSYLY